MFFIICIIITLYAYAYAFNYKIFYFLFSFPKHTVARSRLEFNSNKGLIMCFIYLNSNIHQQCKSAQKLFLRFHQLLKCKLFRIPLQPVTPRDSPAPHTPNGKCISCASRASCIASAAPHTVAVRQFVCHCR